MTSTPQDAQRYDEQSKTLWLYRDYDDPDTLVPNDELRSWSKAARDGRMPDGRPLSSVRYVFANDQTASYNQSALSYACIETYTGSLDAPKKLDGAPSFEPKEDFGIS